MRGAPAETVPKRVDAAAAAPRRMVVLLGLALTACGAEAQTLRRIEGRRLTLVTDLPPSPEIDRLPQIFDEAVPQWARFFDVALGRAADWRMTGCLMGDRQRFQAAGLLGPEVPPFRHGYTQGDRLWLDDQPSDYYRRHLLLHEGAHAFQAAFVGSSPPWHQEGVAELLGTHQLDAEGRLALAVFPARKEDAPRWGRIGLVRRAIDEGREQSIKQVLALGPEAHQNDEAYGWCWALAVFLDRDPRYGDALRRAAKNPANMEKLHDDLASDASLRWPWRQFTRALEFGYDLDRAAIATPHGEPSSRHGGHATIRADRGWQTAGMRLEAGGTYRITARGRFVVARTDRDWISEPPGVTIRYHEGRPLGQLLAAVVDEAGDDETWAVGSEQTVTPLRSGELMLKVNDSPAELAENRGQIEVEVHPE